MEKPLRSLRFHTFEIYLKLKDKNEGTIFVLSSHIQKSNGAN